MTKTTPQEDTGGAAEESYSLIDADIHNRWYDDEQVTKYLPKRYQKYGIVAPTLLYRNPGGFFRQEDVADDGTKPAADLEQLASEHFDANNIDYGMFTGNSWFNLAALPNRDYAVELARAYNEFLVRDCLPVDDRFLGSIYVAPKAPEKSAELIREYGPPAGPTGDAPGRSGGPVRPPAVLADVRGSRGGEPSNRRPPLL